MAKIVLGVATSHSPQLSTPLDQMHLHAERDLSKKEHYYKGKYYSTAELSEYRKSEGLESFVSQDHWEENYHKWELRIAEVREKLAKANPDILVVIGDDQRELFLDDGMPAFSVFWGEKAVVIPKGKLLPSLEPARWANFGERVESIPTHPELGKHIIESMIADGFDITQLTRQPAERGIGHSYIFTKKRLMNEDQDIPMVPVMINTYFPPNQPTVYRCYSFGQALRRAIESWDSDKRVAIVASGGLSHFVVDEELDRRALKALKEQDRELLSTIQEHELVEGTSEIRNWIAAGGALEHMNMNILEYIPAYRTTAGTGCGMAFAWWE
jgi:3-O-methylgallate 3,4-dioxygenase